MIVAGNSRCSDLHEIIECKGTEANKIRKFQLYLNFHVIISNFLSVNPSRISTTNLVVVNTERAKDRFGSRTVGAGNCVQFIVKNKTPWGTLVSEYMRNRPFGLVKSNSF